MWTLLIASALMAEPPTTELPATPLPGRWVQDATPQLEGPLSAAVIQSGINAVQPQVQQCYAALHAQYPNLTGPIEVRLVVTPDGSPTDVSSADERYPVSWFQGCLEDALGDARFALSIAPTTVSWTLNFGAGAFSPSGIGGLINATRTPVDSKPAAATQGGATQGTWGEHTAAVTSGEPVILGSLDRSLIEAVITQNLPQIRYCYQRQLARTPELAGSVTVRFEIAQDGSVSKAETRETTMNNVAVEGCLNDRFTRFYFPKPKGSGVVIVTWPFTFSPG